MEWMTFWTAVAGIGGMGAAVAAAVATYHIRQGERARLLSEWLIYYSSDEMGDALSALAAWHNEDPATSVSRYVAAVSRKPPDAAGIAINKARRRVAHYFFRMAMLWRENLIDTRLLGDALQASTFDFFVSVVAPIDEAHAAQISKTRPYDMRPRDLFRRVAEELRREERSSAH